MKKTNLILGIALLFAAAGAAAKQDKISICHVGNEIGPGGETYLDDPDCEPNDLNDYFCPDAGKIDLIIVATKANHLGNPSHTWDGISDYEPTSVGATGTGTEDLDGDGIDEGCEVEQPCPCWQESALLSVTADNQAEQLSCDNGSLQPYFVLIQNNDFFAQVEGGFAAEVDPPDIVRCSTRDFPPYSQDVTVDEALACYYQIVSRCAVIGSPIPD